MRFIAALMSLFVAVHAVAEPCPEARPISQGEAALCSGIVLPDEQARLAVRATAVDLPELRAALVREEAFHKADEEKAASIRRVLEASLKEALAQPASDGDLVLAIVLGTVGLAAGLVGGYFIGRKKPKGED